MSKLSKRELAILAFYCCVASCQGFGLDDIKNWFLDLVKRSPKIVVNCVLNDIEQTFLDVEDPVTLSQCGFEAFSSILTLPPEKTNRTVEVVESDDKREVFVFDTPDQAQIRNLIECLEANIDDIQFTRKTVRTASRGIRKSNIISYVSVCLLEEVLSDTPCFARDTIVCRLHDATSLPEAAFIQCFEDTETSQEAKKANRVPMSGLSPGDLVLSKTEHGEIFIDRVLVIFHRQKENSSGHYKEAPLIKILHSGKGSLSVTPDHILFADGDYKPASEVRVGSILSDGLVVKEIHQESHGQVINPITSSGTILAGGDQGLPVLSTTVADSWIGNFFINSPYKKYSASLLLAKSFPSYAQDYYETFLASLFVEWTTIEPPAASPSASVAIVALYDLVIAFGYILYMIYRGLTVFGPGFFLLWIGLRLSCAGKLKGKKA